jgi:succinate dehydrogenase / fumarate reductase, cytochrome b subunit
LASLVLTLTETLRYRGAIGQWSWVLHRLTGLGVVFFLILHVVDTSWAIWAPDLYVRAIAAYQSPLFTLGEFGLVFAVVYHAYNGLRIILFDFKPQWWRHQSRAALVVIAATVVTLIPVFFLMFAHVLRHYNDTPMVLPLDVVLLEQLPFAVGIVAALILAVVISGIVGMVSPDAAPTDKATGSRTERFWWSFMRVSGLLIVPLVFGHLAIMHIVQGVFDIQGSHVIEANLGAVGTDWSPEAMGINMSGTAVEFVGDRWNTAIAGVYVWRLYDAALLALAVIHGFNGLRYVLTDYTMSNPFLRRTAVYFCMIGALILIGFGSLMLFNSVNSTAIEQAQESLCHLYTEHAGATPEVLQCAESGE